MCVPLRLTKASLSGIRTGQSWWKIIFQRIRVKYVYWVVGYGQVSTYKISGDLCAPPDWFPSWNGFLFAQRLPCHTAALLHNNRVYRMADEWVDFYPRSSYVLRNGFGERGNYTLSQKIKEWNRFMWAFYAPISQYCKWAWRRNFYADSGSFLLGKPSCNSQFRQFAVVDAFYASLQIRCVAHNLLIAEFTEYKKNIIKTRLFPSMCIAVPIE